MGDLILRKAQLDDLSKIASFFLKAYGPNTAFQSSSFLKYYFRNPYDPSQIFSSNWIGLNPTGEIVSHYGGLQYKLQLGEKTLHVVWGVNAYTLPEYRGLGFNGNLVKILFEENVVNATLGMSLETHKFYKKLGYEVFDHLRFSRFILNFKEDSFLIISGMGQNTERAQSLVPVTFIPKSVEEGKGIQPVKNENLKNYSFDLGVHATCTTHRDKDFISWRFLDNPFIDYKIFIEKVGNQINAYAVIREEKLEPSGKKIGRIIDLYGSPRLVGSLLERIKIWSFQRNHIYLEFSKIGNLYSGELLDQGFIRLDEDDAALFPQVSSPVENRPNQEYLAIYSNLFNQEIRSLRSEDIYFTRMDSDRDRIARLDQTFKTND
ncbi:MULTISPECIES: GNAT family N-acetyltransferase [unclassified Algoriphagus]|jgi:hypothetical protein|uniref:GNAT family N-acetyltransferase n=1 Tax=unclassified Algoriphagus TaxID=2641541 RepID=UPI000C3E54BD|nr:MULTISPECIES: GNAT family N-acetyltransferase [unclassified Algoriphagus]MAL14041.1 hypothetical protein [Algoriphagus sp.]HAS58140.1 hypothetical protein [Algoriphagus sp.]|tara:strand:- start:779 stop:1909 length:1131 start_codon:yes stop_codon:yes gene_type:complete